MKKNYAMLAFATLMMAACANNDLVDDVVKEEVPQAIGFEEFVGKSTRGINTTNLNDFHDGFGVWAYKGDAGSINTPVMENYNVVYDAGADTKWIYKGKTGGTNGETVQTLKYWDKLKAYEFYAYAPYNKNVKIVSKDIQITEGQYAANENLAGETLSTTEPEGTYTGEGNVATNKTTDWMIAAVIPRAANETSTVQEAFTHTLSRLIVNLKSTTPENITINTVSVNNVYGTGEFKNNKWSVTAGDEVNIPGATGTLVGKETNPEIHYCMEYLLIPSTKKPTFSINYTINGDTYNVEDVDIEGIDKFLQNTCYELTVTIEVAAIKFSATNSIWATPTDGGVTID